MDVAGFWIRKVLAMNLILLVDDNAKRQDMFSLNLEMYSGAGVIKKNSLDKAQEVLKVIDKIALIITYAKVATKDVAFQLYTDLKGSSRTIPMIVLGKEEGINDLHVDFLEENAEMRDVVQLAAKTLGVTALDMATQMVPHYFPMPTSYFKNIHTAPCDVYIRHKESAGNFIYTKVLFAGLEFEETLINDFIEKGTMDFYVDKADRLKVTAAVTSGLFERLTDKNLDKDDRLSATEVGMELASFKINNDGLTLEVVQLCDVTIQSIVTCINDSPTLKLLLARLLKNQSSFAFKHSLLITYITNLLNKQVEWGSSEQADKLGFLAFFHDITLDRDELVCINSQAELDSSTISDNDKLKVGRHAFDAAELVAKYPRAPLGVDQLIRQHHGELNGIGFTSNLQANLSPLVAMFMIAEDYVHEILNAPEGKFDLLQTMIKLRSKYTKEKFRKMLSMLERVPYP